MSAETNSLSGAGAEIAAVAERFGRAVVGVGRGWRVGSGFVVAPGSVLTAARHVDNTVGEGTAYRRCHGTSTRSPTSVVITSV